MSNPFDEFLAERKRDLKTPSSSKAISQNKLKTLVGKKENLFFISCTSFFLNDFFALFLW